MPADIVVHHPSVNGTGDSPGVWSPAQWRHELASVLDERQESIDLYSRYYDGQHRLQFATSKFKEAFGELFEAFATNWMALICDSAVERLNVQGFRFDEDDADDEAWNIWQTNGLDAKSIAGHTEAIKCGTAYLAVGPPTVPGGEPVITVEHPSQVIVAHDESDRRIRLAALKRYRDIQTGDHVAVVYLPDRIVEYRQPAYVATLEGFGLVIPVGVAGYVESSSTPNPLGIVPIIPLENNPSLLSGGRSDLESAIPLNDAANKFFSDMIHASEFTSFPQRVLTGVELPRDPITGEVADEAQIRAAVSRLWTFESSDARVFDLPAGNLDNYVAGIRVAVQHMAAQPLALETVVPTPSGRKAMGQLAVGDEVFDPDGNVQFVDALSPIFTDRECYRLRFDDGTEVVADAGHLWRTTHRPGASRNRPWVTQDVSTKMIAGSLGTRSGQYNHFIPVSGAPDPSPRSDLAVDPYALGVWLGDGCRGRNTIASHRREASEMAAHLGVGGRVSLSMNEGGSAAILTMRHDVTRCRYGHTLVKRGDRMRCMECHRVEAAVRRGCSEEKGQRVNASFVERLESMGVRWDKRIPERYFLGSFDQRLALLQGLMDADGTVDRRRGSVAFVSCNATLARDVHRLVQSLGHKVAIREGRSNGFGLSSPNWRMSWSSPDPVFRLKRKLAKQCFDWTDDVKRRYVVACEPVESVPVRCIRVSGASHLFCVADAFVATHNTRTPPHYLLAEMVNISGDALVAAETGLVARCRRKQIDFSDSWEEAIRLAFRWRALSRPDWVGSEDDLRRAEMTSAETIWADPESRNPGQVGDALIKKRQVGVPELILWEEAGYTPQQIKRMKVLREAELEAEALRAQQQAGMEAGLEMEVGVEEEAPTVALSDVGGKVAIQGLPGPNALRS